jgi:NTE family protein
MDRPSLLAVAFGAGGLDGFQELGALHVLQKEGKLRRTRRFVGTSAGSIVAFIAALGMRALNVMKYVAETDTSGLFRFKLTNLTTDYGMDDATGLFAFLSTLLESLCPGASELTFAGLREATGHHLMVSTTCLTDLKLEVMDPDHSPDLRIIDVVRASCSVPLLFTSPVLNNKRYVDGGLLAYHPHKLLHDLPCANKLLIIIAGGSGEIDSFFDFMAVLMKLACTQNQLDEVGDQSWVLQLSSSEGSFTLQELASRQKLLQRFNSGAIRMRKYVKERFESKPKSD